MGNRLVLIAGVIMLPLIYGGFMTVYTTWFQKQSRERRPLFCAIPECLVILSAEAAFLGIWRARTVDPISVMMFWLLFVMLAAMTVFCVIDYREQVVHNCFLMILLLVFALIIGVAGLKHIDVVLAMVPSIVLGFLFCLLSFGMGYVLSHRRMGAGDVKLTLVMGLYLTGEYVVGAVFYGCVAAALFSVIQLARKKLSRNDSIPFVPFLFVGLVLRYLAG